ncbi:MAG: nitrite reductase, copper-containing [Chitinophagaceae bacterium]|nr:nitrite reductase, copper-containing [Chitinophagaceae bacterium]
MKNKFGLLKSVSLLGLIVILGSCNITGNKSGVIDKTYSGDGDGLPRVQEELVAPPGIPKFDQVEKGGPKIIEVTLTAEEKKMEVAPGDSIWAMTFNGSVPAPLIVAHEGDFVELTLKNPASNTQGHNIDFHASTGKMGGGDISHVQPGQQVTFRFRTTRAGAFVYHCAPGGLMTPMHVVSGMNGVILVLPKNGLTDENGNSVKFDTAFYIVQQEYYLPKGPDGKTLDFKTPAESLNAMQASMEKLIPTNIVFNGYKGSLTGKNALNAKVGQKVLFISADANSDTRMHLIGGHADLYWPLGKFHNKPLVDLETWNIPAGSAAAALYRFREPGDYVYLDHNLIDAIAYGAMAQIKVSGKWDNSLMKVISKPGPIK